MAARVILIKTCARFHKRREACEQTWAGELRFRGTPVYFVEGGHTDEHIHANVIHLRTGDSYDFNSFKVRDGLRVLLDAEPCEHVFVVDDDAFVHPERWLAYQPEDEFVGLATEEVPWPHGGCGWFMSRRCCELFIEGVDRKFSGDDVLAWSILTGRHKIEMVNRADLFSWKQGGERPSRFNKLISCHYVHPAEMRLLFQATREIMHAF